MAFYVHRMYNYTTLVCMCIYIYIYLCIYLCIYLFIYYIYSYLFIIYIYSYLLYTRVYINIGIDQAYLEFYVPSLDAKPATLTTNLTTQQPPDRWPRRVFLGKCGAAGAGLPWWLLLGHWCTGPDGFSATAEIHS